MPFRDRFQTCFRCAKTLVAFSAAACRIQRCDECGGAWVDHGTLAQMFRNMKWDAEVRMSRIHWGDDEQDATLSLSFELDGTQHEHTTERPITKIGKLSSSHLRIDHPSVSRMHAVLEFESPTELKIIDLGSTTGTWVNGNRINSAMLTNEDTLDIGEIRVNLSILQPATEAPTDARQCLGCQRPMAAMHIERIPVDVCEDHGVWFDEHELQQVLMHAAE
jgi:Zn-finger nucleic acid-binding protein